MQFNVPQFIEHEPRIIGPLTFKQFLFIGAAVLISFILYRLVSFFAFIFIAIILGSAALALAFLKIGGIPLSTIIVNFLKFIPIPKIYIWQRSKEPERKAPVIIKDLPKKNMKKDLPLKVVKRSRLQDLHAKIEAKPKLNE